MLRLLDPDLRLARCWEPPGGVSAAVTGIEAERPGGDRRLLVLRQYGTGDLQANARLATTEYQVLAAMHDRGVPAPRPLLVDESGTILPGPCLVVEFVHGSPLTGPPAPPGFITELAALLAGIHRAGIEGRDIAFLPDMSDVVAGRLGRDRPHLDHELSEPVVRAALATGWPPAQVNRSVVLHGDYWPGNLTNGYCASMPDQDLSALPLWDLYAALRPAGAVTDWGLSPARLAQVRAGHVEFVRSALQRL